MGEEEFVLGATSQVVRVGDTVRRPVGQWTASVHALLRHLQDAGFEGAPRVLGFDEQGREVLTYLPSEPTWPYSQEALVGAARLVRRLHGALDGFTAPAGAVWRLPRESRPGCHVGHNDLGPPNTVYAAGVPYGFIDWELAGPAPPLYDLAWAAINFTPLRPDHFCRSVGFAEPPDRGARLQLFCDAYGLADPLRLRDKVEAFEREALHEIVELGGAGVSPFDRFLA
ncbi:MAG: phosphotransferase, partial [Actinobacteria bacterium]|nr:phosphotransferase [Actinomycetota bacterium]